MLAVTADADLDALADHLAGVLARPVADPLAPEWVVVVSAGMQRWVRLALARRLGTSGEGRGDGVAANLDLLYPGRLTGRLLHPDDEDDPWALDRLVWAVLAVVEDRAGDDRLGPALHLAPGATRWGRARRLADLLDRYLLHRPGMVRAWARGHDRDEVGAALPADARWQAQLFRAVRDRIGRPSPPELLPDRLAALRAGHVPEGVPERVSLFGLATIPGGAPFLDLLDALGAHRDVHLCLHQPSDGLVAELRARRDEVAAATVVVDDHPVLRRGDDPTADSARHPLLRSWARPAREAAVLLGDQLPAPAGPTATPPAPAPAPAPTTVLARLQADLRADRAPAGDHVPPPDDRSVVVHSCHGATRQVEVLRDQVLHLLADDPTLREDDVVVLCPALERFAPLLEAVLGPSAGREGAADDEVAGGPPALAYRIADRSLGSAYPLLRALAAVVELLASRCSDAAVLDLANLPPVRERFGFDDAALDALADWVEEAGTCWGLDGDHREGWGVPAAHAAGTWATTLDRLLLGVAVTDDPTALAVGGVVPVAVDGGRTALAGRFADLLERVRRLHAEARAPRPIAGWVDLLARAADELLAPPPEGAWQRARLHGLLADLADAAGPPGPAGPGAACDVPLDLDDLRQLLGRHLDGPAGRVSFFRGGVTISSLTPLRGIPHRVVCLLGMDEDAFGAGAPDGDDLTATHPLVGDRDRRADVRQGLLESVQAARDHLVVLRTGHSVVTNQPVPPATVVAELCDAVTATVAPEARAGLALEVVHPRQRFDERSFVAGGDTADGDAAGGDGPARLGGPWSFDPLARDGAEARRRPAVAAPPLLAEPLPDGDDPEVVDLAELADALVHPPRHFVRRVLDVALRPAPAGTRRPVPTPGGRGLPRAAEGRDLVLELDGLATWQVRDALLAHCRGGGDPEAFARRLHAAGTLPPGRLGDAVLADALAVVTPLLDRLDALGVDGDHDQVGVDVRLPDGTRVVGRVPDAGGHRPGPVVASVSGYEERRELAPWLDVVALTAARPERPWAAVLLHRPRTAGKPPNEHTIEIPDVEDRHQRALDALAVVVDLHRRARREPLPLFPRLSLALHRDRGVTGAWTSGPYSAGDDADPYVRLAFGRADLAEITALPPGDDDPPGPARDRARRWASHLWGAVDASRAEPDDADEDGDPGSTR